MAHFTGGGADDDEVGAGAMDGYDTGHQLTEWEEALMKHGVIDKLTKSKKQDDVDTTRMWKERERDPHADKTMAELEEADDLDIDV